MNVLRAATVVLTTKKGSLDVANLYVRRDGALMYETREHSCKRLDLVDPAEPGTLAFYGSEDQIAGADFVQIVPGGEDDESEPHIRVRGAVVADHLFISKPASQFDLVPEQSFVSLQSEFESLHARVAAVEQKLSLLNEALSTTEGSADKILQLLVHKGNETFEITRDASHVNYQGAFHLDANGRPEIVMRKDSEIIGRFVLAPVVEASEMPVDVICDSDVADPPPKQNQQDFGRNGEPDDVTSSSNRRDRSRANSLESLSLEESFSRTVTLESSDAASVDSARSSVTSSTSRPTTPRRPTSGGPGNRNNKGGSFASKRAASIVRKGSFSSNASSSSFSTAGIPPAFLQ